MHVYIYTCIHRLIKNAFSRSSWEEVAVLGAAALLSPASGFAAGHLLGTGEGFPQGVRIFGIEAKMELHWTVQGLFLN